MVLASTGRLPPLRRTTPLLPHNSPSAARGARPSRRKCSQSTRTKFQTRLASSLACAVKQKVELDVAGATFDISSLSVSEACNHLSTGVPVKLLDFSLGELSAGGGRTALDTMLATFDLSRNSIGAAGAAAIGQGLATNKTLMTLNLGWNSFGDAGWAAIGQVLLLNVGAWVCVCARAGDRVGSVRARV